MSAAHSEQGTGPIPESVELAAKVARALSEKDRRDLRRLLSWQLTAPNTGEQRIQRLGLLLDIIGEGTGEVPTVARYLELRSKRSAAGESWPTHATLIEHFGSWVRAVRAAMTLHNTGLDGRVKHTLKDAVMHTPYTRDEAIAAVIACKKALGMWPTCGEYEEFRLLSREVAGRAGKPDPRYPTRVVWSKLLGHTWEEALDAVRRAAEQQGTDTASS